MGARRLSQCVSQAREGSVVLGQAEPQEVLCPIEAAAPDMLLREAFMPCRSIVMPGKTEQIGSANDSEACILQDTVEPDCIRLQRHARARSPAFVAESGRADCEGWTGHSPRTESLVKDAGNPTMGDSHAEPHARKTIKLPKRTQDDYRQVGAERDCRQVRRKIHEGLVDDEPAIPGLQELPGARQGLDGRHPSIRIVRVDNDGVSRVLRQFFERIASRDRISVAGPRARMLAVGWRDNRDLAGLGKPRQPLNERLRAWCRDKVDTVGDMIGGAGRIDQLRFVCAGRQTIHGGDKRIGGDGPRIGVDAGGQVHPCFERSAVKRDRISQVATMFHACLLPLFSRLRERVLCTLSMVVFGAMIAASPTHAKMPRIASINVCTDQLLLALADPEQIIGLSPYSRDAARSWAAAEARKFPLLSGEAEDVLVLKPDVVVAGRFTKRATRELLKEKGLRVVEFDAARTIDDVRAQIRRMGDLIGQQDRAQAQIAQLDAALARARATASRNTFSVLPVSRRGWVSGGESLISALLKEVGLSNKAGALGLKLGGFASLETIVSAKPDLILLSDSGNFAEDQGKAFLLHPALEQLYPPKKRIVVPERLTVCGGPMLSDALDRLTSELARVER